MGVPFSLLVFVTAIYIYQNYVQKLQESHHKVFYYFLAVLIIVSLGLVIFIFLLSMYLQSPEANRHLILLALIPYYVVLLTWTAFLIYISPGLLDKVNGIPFYQFLMFCVYTFVFLIYPVLFLVIAMQGT